MSQTHSDSHAESNGFLDLSGVPPSTNENPYSALIESCGVGSPSTIHDRYQIHREARNNRQAASMLSPDFPGFVVDPILQKLVHPELYPGYVDPRNCLVFWARPPEHLRELIMMVQQKIRSVKPDMWFMPPDCLHMTTLEITHSLTEPEVEKLIPIIEPKLVEITDYTYNHRVGLVKPLLSYDNQAIAVSFLPASGKDLQSPLVNQADEYTYHHLRRDLYDLCKSAGITVASRYVVPSAHLTIARFVSKQESGQEAKIHGSDGTTMHEWIKHLGRINTWLKENYWPESSFITREMGEWVVGQEKGLVCRKGTVWYGGGATVRAGRGFT